MSDGTSLQQKADLRREIEVLKAQAEAGMGDGAQEAPALAREKLLHMHRARFAANGHLDIENSSPAAKDNWTSADITALEWICRLAGAGHVGAERLAERALSTDRLTGEYRLRGLLEVGGAIKRMSQLAEKCPPVARYLARMMSNRSTDQSALTYWLDRGGPEAANLAADIRELDRQGYAGELILIDHFVDQRLVEMGTPGESEHRFRRGDLLAEFVERRWRGRHLYSAAAMNLLERAAELGSRRARQSLWQARYEAARDGKAFLREWLATQPRPEESSATQCELAGRAIELGQCGASPDPNAALRWYGAAFRLQGTLKRTPSIDDPETCFIVARALDRGNHVVPSMNDALALAWYERGLALGSVKCLNAWLSACARGKTRTARDPEPDDALERVKRFIAAGGDPKLIEAGARETIRRVGKSHLEGGSAELAPALAAKWMQVGALLGDPLACYHLGLLYASGRGVARDPESARAWLAKTQVMNDEQIESVLTGSDLAPPAEDAILLAWYERGSALGNVECMNGWLSACVDRRPGSAQDPDTVLKGVERFIAAGGDVNLIDEDVSSTIRRIGESPAEPALAVRWMQAGALLGDQMACTRLGEMYARGRGVIRDPETARAWLAKSGLWSDAEIQLLLAKMTGE